MIQLAQVQPKAPELTFWEKAIKRYRKEHEDEDSLDCEIRAKLIDANVEQVAKDKPKRESWVAPEHQRDAQFPAWAFWLVWRKAGTWQQQRILA